jgi:Peptidase family M23
MRCYNSCVSRALRLSLGLAALALLLPAAASAYSWPLRPFYQQHAIRGYFSDPRLTGAEAGFHFGVDIVANDLQPVYAVEGGRARVRGESVSILPRQGGRRLSYWHLRPIVGTGQAVRRRQLIGHVVPGSGHLHFAEYSRGTYVNPLRLGGLAPYIDDTVPRIPKLSFVSGGAPAVPESVAGVVDVTLDAYDPSPLPLPPAGWAEARLAPALIRWQLVRGQDVVRPWETVVDFRTFMVPRSLFHLVYAPGTAQNRPGRPGRYEYYLAHDLDTSLFPNGSYVLQVDVLDAQENLGQAWFPFTVRN